MLLSVSPAVFLEERIYIDWHKTTDIKYSCLIATWLSRMIVNYKHLFKDIYNINRNVQTVNINVSHHNSC